MLDAADHDLSCPYPKGTYRVINHLVSGDMVPPFPTMVCPSGKMKWWVHDDIFILIEGKKKMVKYYSYDAYGWAYDGRKFNDSDIPDSV